MKILHTVEFYYPSVGGAQEVVRQLSERMAAKGHDVTVATTKLAERTASTINGVKIVEFAVSGNDVRGLEGDVDSYRQFLLDSNFDVIMNYAAQQWASDIFFSVMDKVKGHKVFVPCGFSGLYDPSYEKYFEDMPRILKSYDASVYLSDNYRDINFAREHGVSNIHIIPNGAGEDEFGELSDQIRDNFRKAHGIRAGEFLVANVSNHTGEKGHYEMLAAFFLAPIRHATFCLVGGGEGCSRRCKLIAQAINSLTWLTGKKVQLLSLPRAETVKGLKAADVFLFLSNIEASPLVLFESAACALPFISTDVGNAAEIAKWTGGGEIVATKPAGNGRVRAKLWSSARVIARLGNDPEVRHQLGQAGRRAWEGKFTWDKITQEYLDLYNQL